MTGVATAIIGAAVVGAVAESESSKRAARSIKDASKRGIESQEAALAAFNLRTQPFSDLGLSAGDAISDLLGLPRSTTANPEIARLQSQLGELDTQISTGPTPTRGGFGRPAERTEFNLDALQSQRADLQTQIEGLQAEDIAAQQAPRGGQLLEDINPLVSFIRDQGFEDIQESAAARGRLGAGGTLQDLTRFNTQLGGTLVPQLQNQRFNQLFNLLGLGANAATGQGTAALQTGVNVSNLQGNIGAAGAQNALNQGNIPTGLTNQLAWTFGAFLLFVVCLMFLARIASFLSFNNSCR